MAFILAISLGFVRPGLQVVHGRRIYAGLEHRSACVLVPLPENGNRNVNLVSPDLSAVGVRNVGGQIRYTSQ